MPLYVVKVQLHREKSPRWVLSLRDALTIQRSRANASVFDFEEAKALVEYLNKDFTRHAEVVAA